MRLVPIRANRTGEKLEKGRDEAHSINWKMSNIDHPVTTADLTTGRRALFARNQSRHIGLVIFRGNSMQKFFFDMKDGVPHRDTVGIEFKTNAEAIGHCKEIAQHFRDESLRDDQDLEISVVNSLGREIHREFVHREEE